ncbi:hypothetical protein GDO86_012824, partial [Hymenochirus boettgeri]
MHSENKLVSHGKTSSNGGQSQPPNVKQGAELLGTGPKTSHVSPTGVGLKTGESQGPCQAKGQSESVGDVAEKGETRTPLLEQDPKGEIPLRSKRRCVLERKQPYSGDEWCSGPESEEDEKNLVEKHNCNAGEPVMSAPALPGTGSAAPPGLNDASSSSTLHGGGPSLHGGGGGPVVLSKTQSQLIYVFTTYLANKASEAVIQGCADSILVYHQQNVPRAKLDEASIQKTSSIQDPAGALAAPSIPTAPSKLANQPPPAIIHAPTNTLKQDTSNEETKQESTPLDNGSSRPASEHSNPPPPRPPSASLPGDNSNFNDNESNQSSGVTLSTDGLSREQIEHRERSLQTLRDIERLLLRSGATNESFSKHSPSPGEGVPPVSANSQNHLKKYEEPLQSIITQTQSLGNPGIEQDLVVSQPGPDMGHQMSLMIQRMGQDSLTPEQAAWRKLQEEYYAEKRRKEEHVFLHGRPAPEMMLRGPPVPYNSKSAEQWVGNRLQVPLEGNESIHPRNGGMGYHGPRFSGRYGAMQNLPIDGMGVISRSPRWADDVPPVGGGQNTFVQSGITYPASIQGEAERFLNPHGREELLRQQLMDKRPGGMQRQLSLPSGQGIEMDRMMITHRQTDSSMFPGESMGGGPTVSMDFGGSRGMLSPTPCQSGPGRELDPSVGNLNMNMSVNMNMNLNLQMAPHQQMHLPQKMRGTGDLLINQGSVGSEDLVRAARAQNGHGMAEGPQKVIISSQFPQNQTGFPSVQGSYTGMQQGINMDIFGTEHGTVGGTTRLSHMSSLSGDSPAGIVSVHMASNRNFARRSTELPVNVNQMVSPVISHIKSPTLGVHSPLVSSPSGNLKSPHTPGSHMAGLPLPNPQGPPKSPQILSSLMNARSPCTSPGRIKSPQMNPHSPGWASSPKQTISSPNIPQNKQGMGLASAESLGVMDPDGIHSQNPLSLMMSQMSKYALPSSTPLYHNAIKTIATSDDELLPERILLPQGSQHGSAMNPVALHLNMTSSHSPIGNINIPGQPALSHEQHPPLLSSPGLPVHPHTGATMQNSFIIPPVAQEPCCSCPGTSLMSSNQLVFPSRLQSGPPHTQGISQIGGGPIQQQYTDNSMAPARLPHRMSDSYGPGLPSVLSDPELGDVIRPSATGIPEFDLSRIMPSEKPSSTLQYFPKGSTQTPKPHPTNMHLLGLQNMMIEQHTGRPGSSLPGPQGSLGIPPLSTMSRTGVIRPPQMMQ